MAHERVVIVGSSGQDGKILTGLLHKDISLLSVTKNQSVWSGADHATPRVGPGYSPAGLGDFLNLLRDFKPTIVYYFAAAHGSSTSGVNDDDTYRDYRSFIDGFGLKAVIDVLKESNQAKRFFYSGSSKAFGGISGPISEATPFSPKCRYSESKVRAMEYVEDQTRKGYLHGISAVLFHHHSEYRGGDFALSKIVHNIASGLIEAAPYINNWSAAEDFNDAYEVMRVAHTLIDQGHVGRFVIGSGIPRTLDQVRISVTGGSRYDDSAQQRQDLNFTAYADSVRLPSIGIQVGDKIVLRLRELIRKQLPFYGCAPFEHGLTTRT